MKKIISLFQRNYESDKLVRNEVVPGAEWVLNGEGIPTKKFDGTCCMVKDGKLYKRYDAKQGKEPPAGFIAAQDPDKETGHWPGWLLVDDSPQDRWHREAYNSVLPDGTYELIGPKINGNRENNEHHELVLHGEVVLDDVPRDYEGIKEYLKDFNSKLYLEGIVWHHPDGRMVKIKYKDFFKK